METDEVLIDLIMRWENARENGSTLTAEELCAETPERMPQLKKYIEQMAKFTPDNRRDDTIDFIESSPNVPEIPGYEKLKRIGGGGMGDVYKGLYVQLKQERAVKVIRSGIHGKQHLARFRREAEVLAKLEHDNIVTVLEAQLLEGQPYFVMPLIRGGSLLDRIAQYAEPKKAVELMAKVATAVHHAHEHGIIHRDLKPGNILINEEGKPLVSDFGVALLLQAKWDDIGDKQTASNGDNQDVMLSRITSDGAAVGTLPFMAPEQIKGEFDKRTDAWAMGVILYLLLTGEKPFTAKDTAGLIQAITSADYAPPLQRNKSLDRSLANIVVKCLQAKRDNRYPTAAALADDLDAWRHGRGFPLETRKRMLKRQVKRWSLPVVAAAGVVTALWLGLIFSMQEANVDLYKEYLDHTAPLQERLKNGEAVTLIGPGVEKQVYWMRVEQSVKVTNGVAEDAKYNLNFDSRGASFMELLPKLSIKRFRIHAIMQHLRGTGTQPVVGVCARYTGVKIPAGDLHLMPVLAFADAGAEAANYRDNLGHSALFDLWTTYDAQLRPVDGRFQIKGPPANAAKPALMKAPPFRRLTLEVDSKGTKGFWQDGVGAEFQKRECLKIADRNLSFSLRIFRNQLINLGVFGENKAALRKSVAPLAVRRDGGIGVFCNDSTVGIRLFQIEPF